MHVNYLFQWHLFGPVINLSQLRYWSLMEVEVLLPSIVVRWNLLGCAQNDFVWLMSLLAENRGVMIGGYSNYRLSAKETELSFRERSVHYTRMIFG